MLVLDDRTAHASSLAQAVASLGHDVRTVPDQQAAMALLERMTFDLVLLGALLPVADTTQMIRWMKAGGGLSHVPVILIHASADNLEGIASAIAVGADDLLTMPSETVVLRTRIDASIERKRLRDVELRYIEQVQLLAEAARRIEAGNFDPRRLEFPELAARADGLGRLARVFASLAAQAGERDRSLQIASARSERSQHLTGLALVMFAAALWATVGVASRLLPRELAVPDEVYGFARTIVAGPVLLLLAFVFKRGSSALPRSGAWGGFLVFGVCCAIFQVCLFRSFSLLGVTITVFLTVCLPPVLAVVWTMIRGTERISRHVLSALAMAAVGVVAFGGDDAHGGKVFDVTAGLGLSVIASAAFVVMSHAARSLAPDHSPLMIAGLGLVIAAVVLAPVTLVAAPLEWDRLSVSLTDWRSAGLLLYLGLGPTALAYLCYCIGMARCRSAVVGLVASMIEPGVAAALAVLFLHEILSPWEVMGCVLLSFAMLTLWLEENEPGREAAGARQRGGPVGDGS